MTTLTKRIAGLALVVALAVLGAAGPMQAQTTTDRIAGLSGFVAYKAPVKAATTGNIALSGEQTIDGVSVTAGDRVLVKDQTDATENGIYVVATGAWTRATDFNGARDIVSGTQVLVRSGSINAARSYRVTTADDITIGASSIAFDVVDATNLRTFDTRSDITSTPVGSSITHLRTAGYATVGDGGAATYRRANSEPSHALKVQSADGAWWELVPDPMGINVKQAGAKGDGVTDDSQAFIDAINGVGDLNAGSTDTATHRVIVPGSESEYYMGSTTLELKRVVHLLGDGSGLDNRPNPTRLRWDANVTGIIVHTSNTIGATTESTPTGSAGGSIIEGIEIDSDGGTIAGVTDATKGHGIWLRARAVIRNCYIHSFPGNGLHVRAGLGAGGAAEGNANGWSAIDLRTTGNHQNGVYTDGADSNAGYVLGLDTAQNGRWGVHDSSFLGNTYVAPHEATNGLAISGGNDAGESSKVHYNGPGNGNVDRRYAANVSATEAQLVATEPGTDEGIWIDVGAGTSTSKYPTWTSGQPEGTFFHGGAYHTDNINARNLFDNAYHEPDSGPSQFVRPTVVIGGHAMNDAKGTFAGLTSGNQFTTLHGITALDNHREFSPARDLTLKLNPFVNTLALLQAEGDHASQTALAAWDETEGHWLIGQHANAASRRPIRITTDLNQRTYGRATTGDVGGGQVAFERGFWVGVGGNARHQTNGTAAPTSGTWAQGDIVWKWNAGSGDPLGWVAVASGSPGTWAEIRGVGTQTSGAAQAALTDNTGGTTDDTLEAVSGSGADAAINNNFAELAELVDEMRSTLVGFGFMTGGP